jgi:DNA-binding HxlR family transcriptional regulator
VGASHERSEKLPGPAAALRRHLPPVLNTRLAELRDTGTIELRDTGGNVITQHGLELGVVILQLRDWAERWAGSLDPSGPGGKAGLETTGRKGK